MKIYVSILLILFSFQSFAAEREQIVNLSAKNEQPVLLKLIQNINSFTNGSLGGHGTLDVKFSCFMSQTDQFCTISDLTASNKNDAYIDLSAKNEQPVLLKLIQNINSFTNGSLGGHGTLDVKFSCFMSQTDQFCTISDLN